MDGTAVERSGTAANDWLRRAVGKESGVTTETDRAASDIALLPALSELQRLMVEAVRNPGGAQSSHGSTEESNGNGSGPASAGEAAPSSPHAGGLTLQISREAVENGLTGILDQTLADLFSDGLRASVQERSNQALDALAATARRRRVPAAAVKEIQERAGKIRDDMVEQLFSDSLRGEARQAGEKAVQAVLRGDLPSARSTQSEALTTLTTRRFDALQEQWESIAAAAVEIATRPPAAKKPTEKKFAEKQPEGEKHAEKAAEGKTAESKGADSKAPEGKAAEAKSGEKSGRETRGQGGNHESERGETPVPDTVARSTKQVQTMWTRAYVRAAKESGPGRKAEHAAYDALRKQFEKKGDRWVRKPREKKEAAG